MDICSGSVLVLGVGNSLLSDDGFGVHVVARLREDADLAPHVTVADGGTIGLSLLPMIEASDHLIVVDAAELGLPPGHLRQFQDEAMDAHLSQHRSNVHEVAMVDLLTAARLSGRAPQSRTLIAVQPASLDWGDAPTPSVSAVLDQACALIRARIAEIGR